jgi:hypothetical protein
MFDYFSIVSGFTLKHEKETSTPLKDPLLCKAYFSKRLYGFSKFILLCSTESFPLPPIYFDCLLITIFLRAGERLTAQALDDTFLYTFTTFVDFEITLIPGTSKRPKVYLSLS